VSSKILLLEDDSLLGETLVDLLEDAEFEVIHCVNGQQVIDITFNNKFDIYLLDINVPLINGLQVLKELRDANDNTPTIFLTSHKDKLKDAFLSGCDDYIKKPFDNDELLLRINAILKRTKKYNLTTIGSLAHDGLHKRMLYNNEELDLSIKEYRLLLLLMQHINSTVSKELIIQELWSASQNASEGAIRVYVNRIKQLIPEITIQNIRGIGYKLVS